MPTSQPYNEEQLLLQVSNGDETAFAFLFGRHRRKVYFIAWKILKSESAAEDALQEIFLTIWKEREKLSTIGNFTAWLNTITRNYLANRLRKQSNEIIYLRDTLYRQPEKEDDVLDKMAWNELHQALLEALHQLPAQQRKVFELAKLEGLKHKEIASLLNISKGTVKKHMVEATKNIRAHFAALGKDLGMLSILLFTLR